MKPFVFKLNPTDFWHADSDSDTELALAELTDQQTTVIEALGSADMGADEIDAIIQTIKEALSAADYDPDETYADLKRIEQIDAAKRVLH